MYKVDTLLCSTVGKLINSSWSSVMGSTTHGSLRHNNLSHGLMREHRLASMICLLSVGLLISLLGCLVVR